jgi:hypothetical protein
MSSSRYGSMVTVTLVACVILAAAGHPSFSSRDDVDNTDSSLMSETTRSVSFRKPATSELAISDEQRGRIYEAVMRISDAPVADVPAPAVAEPLPRNVPWQDLPDGVSRDIPLVQGHKFVKFDDRILVVNSSSRLVVAMIPRYRLLP